MNTENSRGAGALLKKLNEITVRELVEQLPESVAGWTAAGVLMALAVLPVFVSLTFSMPEAYLQDVMDLEYAGILFTYVFGSYWFRGVLILGALAALPAAFRLARMGYQGELRPDRLLQRRLPFCLALLLCWSFVSALLSTDRSISFLGDSYRQEGFLTYVIYGILFTAALLPDDHQRRWVVEILVGCCAFTGILIITEWECFYLEEDLRAAMFHQYNHYGYFLAICFPLCAGLMLEKPRNLWLHLLRLGEFWLICNAVAFNSVRGSFLAILAALAGWHIVVAVRHRDKWKRLLVLDLIFVATILYCNTGSTLLDRFGTLFDQIEEVKQTAPAAVATGSPAAGGVANSAMDNLGSERGLLWRLGVGFAMEKPVFGHGPDNLGHLYEAYRPGMVDRPHNELIQIAASLGLPALVFYLGGLVGLVGKFFRRFRELSVFQIALFASAGSYLVSSLFGNTMYYTTPYFYILLAFCWQCCMEKETV